MKILRLICAIGLVFIIALVVNNILEKNIVVSSANSSVKEEASEVFPHDEVVEVNINIDNTLYEEMIEQAIEEDYILADITYNGYSFANVAIRPKGNSSLQQVFSSGNDRFSFKVDFDKYIEGQNLFGITKLNLNNLFEDPTLMAEYIGYEMLEELEAEAPDTTYVSLSINDEYYGLYLAVEQVDESFLKEAFGNSDGELYKPESGQGADLSYISDDIKNYEAITPEDDEMSTDNNFIELVTTIDKIIQNGGETEEYKLSDVMNVDSFLKYLAMSTAVIHMDSYQSGMFHNYYLYYNTETFLYEWITWDLNMAFNGFPRSGLTDIEATQFIIDEPVIGNVDQYPLVQAIFLNEEYVSQYHEYIELLAKEYMDTENFQLKVEQIYVMIKTYAENDSNPFYSMSIIEQSIFDQESNEIISLLEFVNLRSKNILQQLTGELPSTNEGEGNNGSTSSNSSRQGDAELRQKPEGENLIERNRNQTLMKIPTERADGNIYNNQNTNKKLLESEEKEVDMVEVGIGGVGLFILTGLSVFLKKKSNC